MIRARTAAVHETKALAAALAELAQPDDLILLAGDLGVGKTAFVQGFGRALGIHEVITSPTFTLARAYEGRLRMHHLDVYRLEQLDESLDVGLPELLDSGSVTLIEWGDVIAPVLPADYLEIRLEFGESDDERVLDIQIVGHRWAARRRVLTTALGTWLEEQGGGAPC